MRTHIDSTKLFVLKNSKNVVPLVFWLLVNCILPILMEAMQEPWINQYLQFIIVI